MSHYTTIRTEFTDLETLAESVHSLGFQAEKGNALSLYDYAGVERGKADLVIRRKHLEKLSNDIGFRKVGNKYKVVISDYDEARLGKSKFLRQLTQRYNYLKVKKETAHQGLKLIREETRADGTIEIVVTT
jgi:hypothetical protein